MANETDPQALVEDGNPASKRADAPARPVRPLSKPGGRLSYWFAGAVSRWVASLTPRTRRRLAHAFGAVAFGLGIRRRVTLDNLRHAYPEKTEAERSAIARGAYENMALTALESLTGHQLSEEEIDRALDPESFRALEEVLRRGDGVLLATAHLGSWEFLAGAMARRRIKINAVVRPLEGSFNARIVEARLESGLQLIPARGAVGGMLRALKRGEPVAMLLDQALPAHQAVFVPFFGRLASTTPALAIAALRTGAPVFVAGAVRDGEALHAFVEGPLPLPEGGTQEEQITALTATVVAALERHIRLHPEQWLWLHRRWKVAPPGEKAWAG